MIKLIEETLKDRKGQEYIRRYAVDDNGKRYYIKETTNDILYEESIDSLDSEFKYIKTDIAIEGDIYAWYN